VATEVSSVKAGIQPGDIVFADGKQLGASPERSVSDEIDQEHANQQLPLTIQRDETLS